MHVRIANSICVLILGLCWCIVGTDSIQCIQATKLYALDPADRDDFGRGVAVHRRLVAVGADLKGANQEGIVYVFENEGSQYSGVHFHQKLLPGDLTNNAHFGTVVKIMDLSLPTANETDQVIVVSAPQATVSGVVNAGAVYLYRKEFSVEEGEKQWLLIKKLVAPSPSTNGHFGASLATHSYLLAVGETGPGLVHLYDAKNNFAYVTPVQGPVTIEPSQSTGFGSSIAFNDDIMIVGQDSLNQAFLFLHNFTHVIPMYTLQPQNQSTSEDPRFGGCVAIGTVLLDETGHNQTMASIGAYFEASTGKDSGALYSFALSSNGSNVEPTQVQRIIPSLNAKFNHYAEAIVITDRFMIASAHRRNLIVNGNEESEVGVVYLYDAFASRSSPTEWEDMQWESILQLVPKDPSPFQFFGRELSVYYDNEVEEYVIAVGANQDSFMSDKAGSAYIFTCKLHGYPSTTGSTTAPVILTTTSAPQHYSSDSDDRPSSSVIAAAVIIPLMVVVFVAIVGVMYVKRRRVLNKGMRLEDEMTLR